MVEGMVKKDKECLGRFHCWANIKAQCPDANKCKQIYDENKRNRRMRKWIESLLSKT